MRVPRHPSEKLRVIIVCVIGIVVATALAFAAPWQLAVLTGWDAAAVTLLAWIWSSIAGLTGNETRSVATREDDSRAAALLVLLIASIVSLVGVILAFIEAEQSDGALRVLLNISSVTGVLLAWAVVHTVSRCATPTSITPAGPAASSSRQSRCPTTSTSHTSRSRSA